MRALVPAVLTVVLIAGCTPAPPGEGDYPSYATVDEMVAQADLVVRGTALSAREDVLLPDDATGTDPLTNPQAGVSPDRDDASGVDVTVTAVRVDEVFKGDVAPGDTIEVSRPAGESDEPKPDSRTGYVMFLATYGPGKPGSLLNPQAIYVVEADGSTLRPVETGAPALGSLAELRKSPAG